TTRQRKVATLCSRALPHRFQDFAPDIDPDRSQRFPEFGACRLAHLGEPEVEVLQLLQCSELLQSFIRDFGWRRETVPRYSNSAIVGVTPSQCRTPSRIA